MLPCGSIADAGGTRRGTPTPSEEPPYWVGWSSQPKPGRRGEVVCGQPGGRAAWAVGRGLVVQRHEGGLRLVAGLTAIWGLPAGSRPWRRSRRRRGRAAVGVLSPRFCGRAGIGEVLPRGSGTAVAAWRRARRLLGRQERGAGAEVEDVQVAGTWAAEGLRKALPPVAEVGTRRGAKEGCARAAGPQKGKRVRHQGHGEDTEDTPSRRAPGRTIIARTTLRGMITIPCSLCSATRPWPVLRGLCTSIRWAWCCA